MPTPYDYNVAQPNVSTYFDAMRQGRTDRLTAENDQKMNALAKYLPGALNGDEEARGLALQAAPVDQMAALKQTFAQMDAPKLAAVKEFRAQTAAGAYGIKDPTQWAAFQEQQRAEAQLLGIPFKEVPFEQKDSVIAMGRTVEQLISEEIERKKLALNASSTQAQNALTNEQIQALRRKPVGGAGGFDNTTFDNMSGLRKEYVNATKDFGVVNDAYGRIKATANNATPAGDLSMIYAYMKMLDPGSVVRESEFALAQNAKPLLDRLGVSWDAVKSAWEGTKLQPQVRADFLNQADALYKQQMEQKAQIDGQYNDLAKRFGFDPSLVVTGRPSLPTQESPPPPQSAPQTFVRGGAGVFSNEPDASAPQPPALGDVRGGYMFLGGNPADKTRWRKVPGK